MHAEALVQHGVYTQMDCCKLCVPHCISRLRFTNNGLSLLLCMHNAVDEQIAKDAATAAAEAEAKAAAPHSTAFDSSKHKQLQIPAFDGYPASFLWREIMSETPWYSVRRPVSGLVGALPTLGIEQAVRYDSRSRGHDLGIKITGT
jgi:hypothetical protein